MSDTELNTHTYTHSNFFNQPIYSTSGQVPQGKPMGIAEAGLHRLHVLPVTQPTVSKH